MEIKHSRCLVLNSDFSPMSIINWKKALTWYMKYHESNKYAIDIIDFYKNDHIIGTSKNYPVPAVVKTKRFFRTQYKKVPFSRKNIFLRDDYTCQYCGNKYDYNSLTYDHVIPKSKWKYTNCSPTCWTNIVTSCLRCNHKKGNKTPKQANMDLKCQPYEPTKNTRYLPVVTLLNKIRDTIPEEWKVYLPESYTEL